jgi:hypothetical protein
MASTSLSASAPCPNATSTTTTEGTVYVVGVDGLTLDVIGPMIEQDQLPHFARLTREGCSGPLASLRPSYSWMLWTTIATGRRASDHGIDARWYHKLLGLHVSRRLTDPLHRAGLKGITQALTKIGLMHQRSYCHTDARAKGFWNVVNDFGGRAGVVSWANLWPIEPVDGFGVAHTLQAWRSEALGVEQRSDEGLAWPNELVDEIHPLIVSPDDVSLADMQRYVNVPDDELQEEFDSGFAKRNVLSELRYVIASDRTTWGTFRHCIDRFPDLRVAAVLFWGMDTVQHAAFRHSPFAVHCTAGPKNRARFGGVVAEEYRTIDRMLGELLDRMAPEDALLVLSDHGFGAEPGRRSYGHKRGIPAGVLYAYGRAFQPGGQIRSASIYDIAPTVLRLCGCPPALDMAGRCLDELLTPAFHQRYPAPDPVPTYGPLEH